MEQGEQPSSASTGLQSDRFKRGAVWLDRHRVILGYFIILMGTAGLFALTKPGESSDVRLYRNIADDLLDDRLPYQDRTVEYPPYVIPIFLFPRLLGNQNYAEYFLLLCLAVDLIVKLFLLAFSLKDPRPGRWLIPLMCYSLSVLFLHDFFLKRYDIFPALSTVIAIWLFSAKRYFMCGIALAVGIGVKVYPAVFVPPLFVLAVRGAGGKKFFAGLASGLLPIVLLSFFLPWWRFAQFQGNRGIHVESLYASVLWLGKQLNMLDLSWVDVIAWSEVHGPSASAVLPWARGLFAAVVIGSTALATWTAWRGPELSASQLARLLLVPLLGFVVFNQVFSPQFMIWLLPLAALAALEGKRFIILIIPLSACLVPVFIPIHSLNLLETGDLLLRNMLLLISWALLAGEMLRTSKRTA